MPDTQDKMQPTCSFCGKRRDEVRKLYAGPTVYICNECMDLCNDILHEDFRQEVPPERPSITQSQQDHPLPSRLDIEIEAIVRRIVHDMMENDPVFTTFVAEIVTEEIMKSETVQSQLANLVHREVENALQRRM